VGRNRPRAESRRGSAASATSAARAYAGWRSGEAARAAEWAARCTAEFRPARSTAVGARLSAGRKDELSATGPTIPMKGKGFMLECRDKPGTALPSAHADCPSSRSQVVLGFGAAFEAPQE
jgi:hypothetical protein